MANRFQKLADKFGYEFQRFEKLCTEYATKMHGKPIGEMYRSDYDLSTPAQKCNLKAYSFYNKEGRFLEEIEVSISLYNAHMELIKERAKIIQA